MKWIKHKPEYKKDKIFQAWVWLNLQELELRYEMKGGYYNHLFGNEKPTKKAIMDLVNHYLEYRINAESTD
jgi:hypothetical protein